MGAIKNMGAIKIHAPATQLLFVISIESCQLVAQSLPPFWLERLAFGSIQLRCGNGYRGQRVLKCRFVAIANISLVFENARADHY